MTPSELAARNYANRRAQLSRLRPVLGAAVAACNALREAKERVSAGQGAFALMQQLKHAPGFFPAPAALVRRMIEEAAIEPGMLILEPSAGKGDIVAQAIAAGASVECVEQNFTLAEHLRRKGYSVRCSDFLALSADPSFDRVLMNPPFERGIDAEHIRHAFRFLKPGGRLVAIASSTTGNKLDSWIAEHAGFCEQLEAGTFAKSERPTNVNTCLIVVDN
jgi:protein-L-isoaspartate O-methyltransferase